MQMMMTMMIMMTPDKESVDRAFHRILLSLLLGQRRVRRTRTSRYADNTERVRPVPGERPVSVAQWRIHTLEVLCTEYLNFGCFSIVRLCTNKVTNFLRNYPIALFDIRHERNWTPIWSPLVFSFKHLPL